MPNQLSHITSIRPHQQAVSYREGERRVASIAERRGAIWLDSGNASQGRYEIISCDPTQNFSWQASHAAGDHSPFALAERWRRPVSGGGELPFYGGIMGYLGYDINQTLETLLPPPPAACSLPLAWLGYYPWALIQEIRSRQAWLVADSASSLQQGKQALTQMDSSSPRCDEFRLHSPWQESTGKTEFLDAVQRIQRYIDAGDCYQVNLARHFQASYSGSPWAAYRQLRKSLPSPYSAYLNTGEGYLLSHSPERFLHIKEGCVSTSPIKGTRPRSHHPETDRRLARELLASSKDRAENVMIVDLLRNDLGRSCRTGSVRVPQLCALQSYANVHHLVSTVEGVLGDEFSPIRALQLAFPGGSITGAPKIRAMDIISELEPVARSAYCGSAFYYSNHGQLDSSITIRSLLADDSHMHCWGGGGIVADSIAEEEYREGLSKIQLLMDTLSSMSTGNLKKP